MWMFVLLLLVPLIPETEMESPPELFDLSVAVSGDTGPIGQKMTCGLLPPSVGLVVEGVSFEIAKFVCCVLFDQNTWAYFTSTLRVYKITDKRKIPMKTVIGFTGNRHAACRHPVYHCGIVLVDSVHIIAEYSILLVFTQVCLNIVDFCSCPALCISHESFQVFKEPDWSIKL